MVPAPVVPGRGRDAKDGNAFVVDWAIGTSPARSSTRSLAHRPR
ncbi:MAG TPA: hypothetical protein VHH09_03250 [Acidimicrobiales bacterium]|nr:hypothetical protein [Acidimicrobiales bacterium]